MEFAPYADWEAMRYLCLWAFLSISAGLMIEYFENKSKSKKNRRIQK
jgi:hypothetical protein